MNPSSPNTNSAQNGQSVSPWQWIPSLYVAQSLPYVVVMSLSVVMYKNLGLSNTDIALYTSWLYLPWVIKPLWAPLIELISTPRRWIWVMQSLVGIALALVAFSIPTEFGVRLSLAIFWLMAFSSATHDIAADGFYLSALPTHQQAAFVGVRSTFYRVGNIVGQGLIVYLVGIAIEKLGDPRQAWLWAMLFLAALFLLSAIYHRSFLPYPVAQTNETASKPKLTFKEVISHFGHTFSSFFVRKDIWVILSFLLLFRLGEAQALKLVTPFLLDPISKGGLGLTTAQIGLVYGTIGVLALVCGGLLGGYAISRKGLRFWLWPMLISCHLPNLVFVYLSTAQPNNLYLISSMIAIEQFGYGFGFAAYLLYMMMVAEGPHKTAHYSLCTGFMALGMMLPGMVSGWIQSQLGYPNFFIWVCIATLPSLVAAAFVKIDPSFGRKVQV
jgi:MFS transporter, PAT family, beta-lactamase induction signal transducer AmpG